MDKLNFITYITITLTSLLNLVFNGPSLIYLTIIIGLISFELIKHKNNTKQPPKQSITITNKNTIEELETAKKVQQALLSIEPPHVNNITIAKKCIPATTLGGDFYTFVNKTIDKLTQNSKIPGILEYGENQNNIIGVAIGDVAGHGVSSALVMALASGLIDRIGQNNHSPATILQRANINIEKFISNSQISHVTAYYGSLNLSEMTFTYSNAGHQPALLIHEDNSYELLSTDGIFLGMYPDEVYKENTKSILPGDRLFLFTDGLIESINKKNEIYGIARLKDIAIKYKELEINDLLEKIYDDLNTFRNNKEARDDQTAIIIEISKNVD